MEEKYLERYACYLGIDIPAFMNPIFHILTLRKHFMMFGIVNLSICLKCANINLETIKMLTNGL